MPQYVALNYSADVDWSAPEQTAVIAEYGAFGEAHGDAIRGGAVLSPTETATTVRVRGARGGEVVLGEGPYAATKEVLTGSTSSRPPTSTRRCVSPLRSPRHGVVVQ